MCDKIEISLSRDLLADQETIMAAIDFVSGLDRSDHKTRTIDYLTSELKKIQRKILVTVRAIYTGAIAEELE